MKPYCNRYPRYFFSLAQQLFAHFNMGFKVVFQRAR
jgi:hypothetical protein